MSKYGQYCPLAKSLDILGDRWTLLIIRDMFYGMTHFNDLERGLPGISRPLLANRLRKLQKAGIIEKQVHSSGRKTTEYHLTQAGGELLSVVRDLVEWGAKWAFGDPSPEELDPVLLMWWMRSRVNTDQLPEQRVVVQYHFRGEKIGTFWMILTKAEVTLCLTDPGYEIDILVTADLATYYSLWYGRISYREAVLNDGVLVEGMPRLVRAFPSWFAWSHAARAVRAVAKAQCASS